MKLIAVGVAVLVCMLLLGDAAFAQEFGGVSQKEIDEMAKRGAEWLKKQSPGGTWDFLDRPFACGKHRMGQLGEGCIAFITFTLLKAGVSRKDPVVQKGFKNAINRIGKLCHCYCVACLILMLEAYYEPRDKPRKEKEDKEKQDDLVTQVMKEREKARGKKSARKRMSPQHRGLVSNAVRWLIARQQNLIWRYPGGQGGNADASNAQYVMLALAAARRLKVSVPASCHKKVIQYFLKYQEKSGPEVPWFPVPAADHDFKELDKIRKDVENNILELAKDYEKRQEEAPESVPPRNEWGTTMVQEAQRKIFGMEKKHKMFARGWAYMPTDTKNRAWCKAVTGSMTVSGIASMIVAKHGLEASGKLSGGLKKKVAQSIRDGAAWLAHHWTTQHNPSTDGTVWQHRHYFLYGIERAAILGLIPKFGEHDWYAEGVQQFQSTQRSDGSWDAGKYGTGGPVLDTAWAILFLKRATKPLIKIPETPECPLTGEGLFEPKPGGDDDDDEEDDEGWGEDDDEEDDDDDDEDDDDEKDE